jgi:hypothetical protein
MLLDGTTVYGLEQVHDEKLLSDIRAYQSLRRAGLLQDSLWDRLSLYLGDTLIKAGTSLKARRSFGAQAVCTPALHLR